MQSILTQNKIKLIRSLSQKKYRDLNKLFIAEGAKIVTEVINKNIDIQYLIYTEKNIQHVNIQDENIEETIEVSEKEYNKISQLKTPCGIMAVIKMKEPDPIIYGNNSIIALENIQDPGNLGTIIRTASWFGIKTIICSKNSVDIHNPKVIQASMGAFMDVQCFYADMEKMLQDFKDTTKGKIFGTVLDGSDTQEINEPEGSILLFGNESKGISDNLLKYIDHKITIHKKADSTVDSLNLANSVAIIASRIL